MANINKIRVSGTTYNIQDISAPKVIELTQSEYDALTVKDPNAFYVITDSEYNFDGYWTSAQTQNAITQSVSSKADTTAVTSVSDSLTAHTANTTVHVTAQDKTNWNAKSDFSGDYNDLTNKPTIPTVPTSNTAFTNDAGYITSDDISGKTNQSDFTAHTANTTVHVTASEKSTWNAKSDFSGSYDDLSNKPTIPSKTSDLTNDSDFATTGDVQTATNDMATKTWVGQQGYLTEHQSLSNYYTKSETSGATEISTALGNKADTTAVTQSINEAVSVKADSADIVDITGFAIQNSNTLVMTREKNGTTIVPLTVVKAGNGLTVTTDAMANKAFDVDTTVIQEKLVSATNIKTINNESILGSGNITIQGGSDINVVQTTGTSTADVMSQDAVTTQLNNKANKSAAVGGYQFGSDANGVYLQYKNVNSSNIGSPLFYPKINGKEIFTTNSIYAKNNYNFQLVETSAITTSVTSSSTDAQVPSAKAVYDAIQEGGGSSYTAGDGIDITNDVISVTGKVDTTAFTAHTADTTIHVTSSDKSSWNGAVTNASNAITALGGLSLVKLTQAEYDALATKDSNTLYVING